MGYTNLYHVYYKMPALQKKDMFVELEELAERLVDSGLLRIDAEPKQNFARFSMPTRNVHIVFSKRELSDERLYSRTYKQLSKAILDSGYSKDIKSKVDKEIKKLKNQLDKFVPVEPELEMQLARILVQSAHPIVFLMIILNQVQVFVSYGNNIGEVMDIVSWQQAGGNSGMQSTDGKNVAVFVSCGGDPLLLDPPKMEGEKKPPEELLFGDGAPALARMMGIAGQETGHYSDIIYNKYGQQTGRYSANFSGTRADPQVDLSRNTDMRNIQVFWKKLNQIGLDRLVDRDKEIQFMRRNAAQSMYYYRRLLMMNIARYIFIYRAKKVGFGPIDDMKNKDYTGLRLQELLSDMMFNLAPVADVYQNKDKNIETAIACIEALARVPQQVNKWGHKTTLFLWRNLYKFYYYKLTPGSIKSYEEISGKSFTMYPNKMRYYTWKEKMFFYLESLKNNIRERFKK
ncbi:MAG: DUF2748 family protein [Pseudomonadota bacterium]